MIPTITRTATAAIATLAMIAALARVVHASPTDTNADLFTRYSGAWSGTGVVHLSGGNVESLKCRAYYTPSNGGQNLGLVIRCASPSTSLELRAALSTAQRKISGSWEERTFNVTGDVNGSLGDNAMDLAISGSAFNGTMRVMFDGDMQKVAITTVGIGLEAVSLSFSRMPNGAFGWRARHLLKDRINNNEPLRVGGRAA